MGKQRNALGKGLEALLRSDDTDVTAVEPKALHTIARIPISQIVANPFQPRTEFDDEALEELAESIKVHGVIQPITVRKSGYDKYELISGERRTRACILAGLNDIPAYIRLANDQQMLEMALIENIQRENLNAIEVALSYQRLVDECNLKLEQLGERVGKKRTTVNNYLRLLRLPDNIQSALKENKLSMGHARALINIEDEEYQKKLFEQVMREQLSVRKVEELSKEAKKGGEKSNTASANVDTSTWDTSSKKLSDTLSANVAIQQSNKGNGKLVIRFKNEQHLESILEQLNNL